MNKDIHFTIIKNLKEELEQKISEQNELCKLYQYLLISLHSAVDIDDFDIYNTYDRNIIDYLLKLPCKDEKNIKNILNAIHNNANTDIIGLITSVYGTLSYGSKKRENAQYIVDLFKLIDKDYTSTLENLDATYAS